MAQKAKKSTKTKKPATKTTTKKTTTVKKPATTTIKSTVTSKKEVEKPATGKIICICAIVVSLLVIIVAVMLKSFGGSNLFVSDGTKYVLNVSVEDEEDNDENMTAIHTIYYYTDDTITGVKTYYEFKTSADAKTAYDALIELQEYDDENYEYELSGKYVIATSPLEEFKDVTASEVKAYIDLYETLQGVDEEETTEDESTEE